MKASTVIPILYAVGTVGVGITITSTQLASVESLGISIPAIVRWLPIPLGCLMFLVLFAALQPVNRVKPIVRYSAAALLVLALWCLMIKVPESYRDKRVSSLVISKDDEKRIDWLKFQSSLDFKVIRVSSSGMGNRIYFERGEGRAEKVQSVLAKLKP